MTTRPGETLEELRATMADHASADGLDRLDAAYTLAASAHAGRVRCSGVPYVRHPLAVARSLAVWDRPADVVLAGLLHDVMEDGVTRRQVAAVAGSRIADLVAAVDGLDEDPGRFGGRFRRRLSLRRGFWRQVATVKVADRLHNAQTWSAVTPQAARQKAANTLAVIAPVASSIGLTDVSRELADLSYGVLGHGTVRDVHILARATRFLPPTERERYAAEWAGDLAQLPPGRDRIVFGAGLLWSALTIRADQLRRTAGAAARRP